MHNCLSCLFFILSNYSSFLLRQQERANYWQIIDKKGSPCRSVRHVLFVLHGCGLTRGHLINHIYIIMTCKTNVWVLKCKYKLNWILKVWLMPYWWCKCLRYGLTCWGYCRDVWGSTRLAGCVSTQWRRVCRFYRTTAGGWGSEIILEIIETFEIIMKSENSNDCSIFIK